MHHACVSPDVRTCIAVLPHPPPRGVNRKIIDKNVLCLVSIAIMNNEFFLPDLDLPNIDKGAFLPDVDRKL